MRAFTGNSRRGGKVQHSRTNHLSTSHLVQILLDLQDRRTEHARAYHVRILDDRCDYQERLTCSKKEQDWHKM